MEKIQLRKIEDRDYERVLELNEESVHFLSPMDGDRLNHLLSQADLVNVVEVDGIVESFVLTLKEGKDYDSVNYIWFSNNYKEFLYIDRVVVSLKAQGKGFGDMLYKSVFEYAESIEVPYVAAEIDINPPNPKSLKFHEKFGFKEVGKQTVAGGKKVVSLQIANKKNRP